MLLAVLSVCSEKGLTDADTNSLDGVDEMPVEPAPSFEEIRWWQQEIKNKILAVGKMQKVFTMLQSVSIIFLISLYLRCWISDTSVLVIQAGGQEHYRAGDE
jgi:hypothetical protein